MGEPKKGPRSNADAQGEKKQQVKGKRKDKGNVKMSKGSEDNSKKTYTMKEKKSILCWICANEHYVKNFPSKYKSNSLEKEDDPFVGVLQVLNIIMEGESDPCYFLEWNESRDTTMNYT